jgi:hypothetical protein
MSTTLTVEATLHFVRRGRGAAKVMQAASAPVMPEPGRGARLMALSPVQTPGKSWASITRCASRLSCEQVERRPRQAASHRRQ